MFVRDSPELAVGRLGFCWTHWSWMMLFDDFDVICGWFRGVPMAIHGPNLWDTQQKTPILDGLKRSP